MCHRNNDDNNKQNTQLSVLLIEKRNGASNEVQHFVPNSRQCCKQ